VRPLTVARPLLVTALGAALLAPAATAAPRTYPGPTSAVSYSARIVLPTVATGRPAGGRVRGLLGTEAHYTGGTNRLLVLGSKRGRQGRLWLRVRLPTRPNASQGWIPGDHAVVERNPWRVEVSTGARVATIRRDGRVVRRVRVGVGRPAYPTPHGLFAVAEKFETDQPGVGRWVLALTAHSQVLTSFAGGPGLIALHGRSNPAGPVAAYSSHGCVVFDNAQVAWLMRTLPEGTPVLIR
jgi:lipoprotein-anchoring transpeptidase ErfK/SrfK